MTYIQLDFRTKNHEWSQTDIADLKEQIGKIHYNIHQGIGLGSENLGWLDLPYHVDYEEIERIKEATQYIQKKFKFFIVIGIGGSYIGAKAAIEMLQGAKADVNTSAQTKVLFVGQNMSSTYIHQILESVRNEEFAVNVISKSGTSLEPALAFRIFRTFLEKKYGKEGARERIFVTTGKSGTLRNMSEKNGYETFDVPSNIGGRFSVLTSVGLLPMSVAGIYIEEVLCGAKRAMNECSSLDADKNPAYQYVLFRNLLYRSGKKIELLVNYSPYMTAFGEWWKQLIGESEGKNGKGIFPATVTFSTDLHSIGQYIQDGERHLFETVLWFEEVEQEMCVPFDEEDLDALNFLSGQSLHEMNKKALQGAVRAHVEGDVPNFVIHLPRRDAFSFGYLVYFFELATTVSSYLNGVNPFDQPGVEAYKKYMQAFLTDGERSLMKVK